MAEALRLVRERLGADAVILHTRSYRQGGFLGIGARTVVEVTAMPGRDYGQRKRPAAQPGTPKAASPAKQTVLASATSDRVELSSAARMRATAAAAPALASAASTTNASTEPTAGELIRRSYAAARAELEKGQASGAGMSAIHAGGAHGVSVVSPSSSSSSVDQARQLTDELRAVKALVQKLADRPGAMPAPSGAPDVPEALVDVYTRLIQQEVAEGLARRIVEEVASALPAGESDASAVLGAVQQRIALMLPKGESVSVPRRKASGPCVVALVGPTGVGKTTTVAKLAATWKLKHGLKVGVVTLDTYRIAAVEQLRTYANIIGTPLEVVARPAEMRPCLERLSGCDVVILDTAGRSQRDDEKLTELRMFLHEAQPDEVHLVLSSTCHQRVLDQTVERFNVLNPGMVIFTKLDEAVGYGTLLNVAERLSKQISYITTGQEVPHQIEPGDARKLASLVMGEVRVS